MIFPLIFESRRGKFPIQSQSIFRYTRRTLQSEFASKVACLRDLVSTSMNALQGISIAQGGRVGCLYETHDVRWWGGKGMSNATAAGGSRIHKSCTA